MVAESVRVKIKPRSQPSFSCDLMGLLATLRLDPARMKLISGFVDTYLKLNAAEEELFQTEIAKFELVKHEVVMEIVTSWELKGRQLGKLEVIMRQLNRKVGAVTPELEAQIRQLSNSQLEDLAEALLDFSNLEDLVAWLQRVSG